VISIVIITYLLDPICRIARGETRDNVPMAPNARWDICRAAKGELGGASHAARSRCEQNGRGNALGKSRAGCAPMGAPWSCGVLHYGHVSMAGEPDTIFISRTEAR
jgi:hypothetical protein